MDDVHLTIPERIVESLPEEGDNVALDMQRAVEGWEARINRAFEEAASDDEAAGYAVDAIETMDDRLERYDAFVPELRAWGQSPIYAIAWRNLQASLIGQLYEHEGLTEHIDRERNARLVEDGIRFGDG
jgi:hypothetical protein